MSRTLDITVLAAAGGIRVTAEASAAAECLRPYLECFGDPRPFGADADGAVLRVVTDGDVPLIPGETQVAIAASGALNEQEKLSALLRITRGLGAALLGSGVVLLHAALAEIPGRRVLMAGASGAGKTTGSRRLPAPWRSLSDDASQVLLGDGSGVAAAPWPTLSRVATGTCDQRWACDDVAPLAGVFYLRHAAADELRRLGGAEAAGNLYESMRQFYALRRAGDQAQPGTVPPADLFAAARRIASTLPVYELGHARRGRFWALIEQVVEGDDGNAHGG